MGVKFSPGPEDVCFVQPTQNWDKKKNCTVLKQGQLTQRAVAPIFFFQPYPRHPHRNNWIIS